jgi:hypothetical protein
MVRFGGSRRKPLADCSSQDFFWPQANSLSVDKMPIPKRDHKGQTASVTMMEFRKAPGEAIEYVAHGGKLSVTKAGKTVGVLAPPDSLGDTVVHSDGTISGEIPLTFRQNLGGYY